MKTLIKKKITISETDNLILLCNSKSKLSNYKLSVNELEYIKKKQKDGEEIVKINQYSRYFFDLPKNKDGK